MSTAVRFFAASMAIFSRVSCVALPMCGVVTTVGNCNNRFVEGGGSCSYTTTATDDAKKRSTEDVPAKQKVWRPVLPLALFYIGIRFRNSPCVWQCANSTVPLPPRRNRLVNLALSEEVRHHDSLYQIERPNRLPPLQE